MIASPPIHPPVAIARARLAPPQVAGRFVSRPALLARLDLARAAPLTLMVAPAGHGKTRTLVEWSERQPGEVAWLTLTPRERELTACAAQLAAALDRAIPGIAAGLYRALEAPDRRNPRDLGEIFGDALYDLHRDLILILDDVHAAASAAVTAFLAGFLAAAPARLHVILSTRHAPELPLARLRSEGRLTEITAGQLRFSPEETASLLGEIGGAPPAPEVVSRVHGAVGGWPAAVRLLGLGLQREWPGDRPGASTAALPTAAGATLLLDYLGEEVLAHLSPSQRRTLLLAALPERFNAPLLAALDPAFIPSDLEALRAFDLFRALPGSEPPWFAYHPLFLEMFRRQLTHEYAPPDLTALHGRAAAWLAAAGETRAAIWHLVHAGDLPAATALITANLVPAFSREDWQAVFSWLELIPEADILGSSPLLLAASWVAFLSGRSGRLAGRLRELRAISERGGLDANEQAQAELLLWGQSVLVGRPTRPASDIVAGVLPQVDPNLRYQLGHAHAMTALGLGAEGRVSEGLRLLDTLAQREAARVDAASLRSLMGRALVLWQAGMLTACAAAAADLLALAQAAALPVSIGWGHLFAGLVAHDRGDLPRAATHFNAIIANAERVHFSTLREAFTRQILLYGQLGQLDEAERALGRLREIVVANAAPEHLLLCDSLAARLALFRGDLPTAARWLAAAPPGGGHFEVVYSENPPVTRVIVLLALATPPQPAPARPSAPTQPEAPPAPGAPTLPPHARQDASTPPGDAPAPGASTRPAAASRDASTRPADAPAPGAPSTLPEDASRDASPQATQAPSPEDPARPAGMPPPRDLARPADMLAQSTAPRPRDAREIDASPLPADTRGSSASALPANEHGDTSVLPADAHPAGASALPADTHAPAQPRLAEARALLTTLRAHAEHNHATLASYDLRLLHAMLLEREGDPAAATHELREALRDATPEQYAARLTLLPLPFGPLLQRALAPGDLAATPALRALLPPIAPSPTPPAPPPTPGAIALTARERDVLRCLERRLTNDEIGDELFISAITARNHVGHICRKLGVSGRRAAVVAAREQGLLG